MLCFNALPVLSGAADWFSQPGLEWRQTPAAHAVMGYG